MKFYLVCLIQCMIDFNIKLNTSKIRRHRYATPVTGGRQQKLRIPGGVSISVSTRAPPVAVAVTHRETG